LINQSTLNPVQFTTLLCKQAKRELELASLNGDGSNGVIMMTLTALRNGSDAPSTAERRRTAETQLARNLTVTDSVRERVRTNLVDIPIEESPIKRDPRKRDEKVLSFIIALIVVII
jgi:hypothetical protein